MGRLSYHPRGSNLSPYLSQLEQREQQPYQLCELAGLAATKTAQSLALTAHALANAANRA